MDQSVNVIRLDIDVDQRYEILVDGDTKNASVLSKYIFKDLSKGIVAKKEELE